MKIRGLLRAILPLLLFASCSTVENISYFQDAPMRDAVITSEVRDIRFKADDKLSIIVNTKDPLLDALFNLAVANRIVSNGASSSPGQSAVAIYTVNPNGEIDFPVLGFVPVAGKNRYEVSQEIKQRLIKEELANDPIVTVEFSGLYFSVMGEVAKPGRYDIDKDKVTLLDALSMAGDLTIYGQRENVLVIRTEGNKQIPYMVNLLDMQNLYSSPVYYLQQNDMVYVEPNDVRVRQSTVNGNNLRSTSFWISLSSLLITISQFLVITL